jgi:GGDEF domain-containing protein/capsular polysaccharide biosynthesis protein
MELRHYLGVLCRWWWLVALPAVGVVALVVTQTDDEPERYSSRASFIVRPRAVAGQDVGRATDTLLRAAEVTPTFAQIATSDAVRSRARARLQDEGRAVLGSVKVNSEVIAGTTVLIISAEGSHATYTRDFLGHVADATVEYVASLNYLFTLAPLDEPTLPKEPEAGRRPFLIGVGGVFGLLLGSLAAFVGEYLRPSGGRGKPGGPEAVAGLTSEDYFQLRFQQEMSRSERTGEPFTVAVVTVTSTDERDDRPTAPRSRHLQHVAETLAAATRPEDVRADVGDGTMLVLLPATSDAEADAIVAGWRRMLWPSTDGVIPPLAPFTISVGVCQYGGRGDHADAKGSPRRISRVW